MSAAGRGQRPGLRRHPRWAWVSLAGAAAALAIFAGGYIGYRSWAVSQVPAAAAQADDEDAFMTAWSQSGFADNLGTTASDASEVQR